MEAKLSEPDVLSRTKEHQRNQMSGLDGLHRSTHGWTGLTVHYAPTPGLDLAKRVLSCAVAAGKSSDNVAAVVDVRRAYFYAELLPKTFFELTTLTSTLGQDAAGDWDGACTEQDKLEGRGNEWRNVSRRLGW